MSRSCLDFDECGMLKRPNHLSRSLADQHLEPQRFGEGEPWKKRWEYQRTLVVAVRILVLGGV